jgi:hypothetical protein
MSDFNRTRNKNLKEQEMWKLMKGNIPDIKILVNEDFGKK